MDILSAGMHEHPNAIMTIYSYSNIKQQMHSTLGICFKKIPRYGFQHKIKMINKLLLLAKKHPSNKCKFEILWTIMFCVTGHSCFT